MLNPEYKSHIKDRPFCLASFARPFLFLLFCFCVTSIAESASHRHASLVKSNGSFNMLNFQEDTVTRPIPATASRDTTREYILADGENSSDKIRKNLFVKADADKTEYYVGEPVIATYKLYSRLIAKSKISRQPALNGFSVFDMIDYVSGVESTEVIENRPFKVHVLRKAQLIPLQAGTMQLDPIEVHNIVHFVKGGSAPTAKSNRLQDLMNELSKEESSPSADVSVKIQSSPVNIIIKSFPEANRPDNFNGAVGRFNIQSVVTTKNLSVNDAGVLKVEIKGRGNVSLIDAPTVKWPDGIDTLDIRFNEKINKAVVPLSGVKTFEYVFTPLKTGTYKIPPISFSFFNASNHRYQTIQTQPNIFEVSAGNKTPILKGIVDSSSTKVNTNYSVNKVINYLKSHLAWIVIVAVLFVISFYLWQKNKLLRKKDEPETVKKMQLENSEADKSTKAPETEQPTDIFEESRMLLEREDYKRFYREMNNVLWNEIAIRLKLPLSELNKQNINMALKHKGWTDEMTGQLESVLVKCERNIYLSDYHQETDAALVLQKAEKLIAQLKTV